MDHGRTVDRSGATFQSTGRSDWTETFEPRYDRVPTIDITIDIAK